MTSPLQRVRTLAVVLVLVVAACGGGGDDVGPTGGFDRVEGGAPTVTGVGDGMDPAVEQDDPVVTPGAVTGDGDPAATPTSDAHDGPAPGGPGGSAGPPGGDTDIALTTWDAFLAGWQDVRNGAAELEDLQDVAVLDEAIEVLVVESVEADAARGTTSVALHGGARSDLAVDGAAVSFVDCVYEKAVGSVPWALAQRWDVTVGLEAGADGGPAVVSATQRATVGADGSVSYDVCLNPVLEAEVVAAHVALREMFVETQEDPAAGIDDPRIDELLMPENATEFRAQLQSRIDDGTRLVNGLGTDLRVQVFGHGLNFVGTISCEDQREGYERVDSSSAVVWSADPGLQALSTYRLVFVGDWWIAERTQPVDDYSCQGSPLASVEVSDGGSVLKP